MKCNKCKAPALEGLGRCQYHLDEHRAWMQRKRAERRAQKLAPGPSDLAVPPLVALYLDARKLVMGGLWQCSIATTPHLQRRVSATYQRMLRARGVKVPGINEPPPGWSIEEDIREEHIALGEHIALRRLS